MRRLAALAAATVATLLTVAVPPAAAARGLTTGFMDDVYGEAPETAAPWVERTVQLGARLVRVNVSWRDVAPAARPAAPADPNDPAYRWDRIDATVRRLRAAGLDVLLSVYNAPRWAEGPNRRASAPAGTWRPDPAQLGQFATAVARRYSGSSLDLPSVRHFMLWNEPNLETYLSPQYTRRANGYRAAAPAHYRRMLAAFAPAVKSVRADNVVVAGATSPYGDEAGSNRMRPATFVRKWLCASGSRCRVPRFDVLSHHPYSVGSPRRKAINRDDVSIPDLGKLTRLLRAARRRGTVRGKPRVWITEFSYDSSPPDPRGIPERRHARWLAETMYLSWRRGASAFIWLLIRDSAPRPSYSSTLQSGVYRRDGRPKLAARAFRFPFVLDGGRAWGKAPVAGRLVIERRSGGRWVRAGSARVAAGGVFSRRIRRVKNATYRARIGDETSLTWR